MSGEDATQVRNEISGGIFFSAVIQGQQITVQLPPEVPSARFGPPTGSPGFVGREDDLAGLMRLLEPDADATAPAVVTGVGGLAGVGKTELVIQAADAAVSRGWFPGGVLFVDLYGYDRERRVDPAKALDGFLRALGIPAEHIPPETQDRTRLYTSVLAELAGNGRRVLVIADNAASAEQVRPLMQVGRHNCVIVTSRHTLSTVDAHLIDLDVLSPAAAVELLNQALTRARATDSRVRDQSAAAAGLARLCGFLPLSLRIIAAPLVENPRRPLAGLLSDLADEHTRLDELAVADLQVRAAFDLSYP
jgi:hypothetical protein